MRRVETHEIGLMFWALPDAAETMQRVQALGFRAGQLGVPGELSLEGQAAPWNTVLRETHFAIATAVCSYAGESYENLSTVRLSVGLVPEFTRAERIARTKEVSDFAAALSIPSVGCHIGFVPHDANDPAYREVRDITREICDHCAGNGQSFALETGQEPADVLLGFIRDVDRANLKINFDPANMVLYGTGDPLEALDTLAPHIVSVHCKDGDPPPRDDANALGMERALGTGSVDVRAFVEKLKSIGYTGILSIEREEPDADQRDADIRSALALLKDLTRAY